MRTGKDGEYYYVELDRDEVVRLMEVVKRKSRFANPKRDPSSRLRYEGT